MQEKIIHLSSIQGTNKGFLACTVYNHVTNVTVDPVDKEQYISIS